MVEPTHSVCPSRHVNKNPQTRQNPLGYPAYEPRAQHLRPTQDLTKDKTMVQAIAAMRDGRQPITPGGLEALARLFDVVISLGDVVLRMPRDYRYRRVLAALWPRVPRPH